MTTFPSIVYLLCLVTSVGCAVLLGLAWRRSRAPLLLWSSLSFAFLSLNNLFVFLDMVVTGADADLSIFRSLAALGAVVVLLYGFIWRIRP